MEPQNTDRPCAVDRREKHGPLHQKIHPPKNAIAKAVGWIIVEQDTPDGTKIQAVLEHQGWTPSATLPFRKGENHAICFTAHGPQDIRRVVTNVNTSLERAYAPSVSFRAYQCPHCNHQENYPEGQEHPKQGPIGWACFACQRFYSGELRDESTAEVSYTI